MEAIATETVSNSTTITLDDLRAQEGQAAEGVTALQADLDNRQARGDALADNLETAKEDLAIGDGSAEAVVAAERALCEHRETTAHVEAALQKRIAKRTRIADLVAARESEAARLRDEEGACPLRDEVVRLRAAGVDGIMEMLSPFREAAAIVTQIRTQFPRAARLPDLTVEDLAGLLAARLGVADPMVALAYTLRLIGGPTCWPIFPIARVPDERLRELGLSRRA